MSLAARDVSVSVGGAALLDHVSLELDGAELVAIIGPNGAGKTTLIRVLAGDVAPDTGSVTLNGRALAAWPRTSVAAQRAVMSSESAVAFGFTARDVALLGRLPIHGGSPREPDRALIEVLLAAVDCTALAERVFATLSTGERQRVQLARAIAQISDTIDPGATADTVADDDSGPASGRFLLLDEPTSSLDPAHQHAAMGLVRKEVDRGHGALVVLHDLNLAAQYADRIVLMKDARVVGTGTPAQAIEAALLEKVFEVPMLVVPHPSLPHPLVVARPRP